MVKDAVEISLGNEDKEIKVIFKYIINSLGLLFPLHLYFIFSDFGIKNSSLYLFNSSYKNQLAALLTFLKINKDSGLKNRDEFGIFQFS